MAPIRSRPVTQADAMLEAIAESARELLRSNDVDGSIPAVLGLIGPAAGVQRVHLFAVKPSAAGSAEIVEHRLWRQHGVPVQAPFNDGRGRSMAQVGLSAWVPRLNSGETISGQVRDFPPGERRFLEQGGILSTVVAPIFVERRWWGFLAFDYCDREHDWQPREMQAIDTLAGLIGAAVERADHVKELADAARIVENSPTVLYRVDARPPFPLIYLSHNFARYGYSAQDMIADPGRWTKVSEPADLALAATNIEAMRAGRTDTSRQDLRIRLPDGGRVWFEVEGRAIRGPDGALREMEGILTNVTETRETAVRLAALARTDVLTGLPNRAAFFDRLGEAIARGRRNQTSLAVIYLDLDRFKDINDTLGHAAGDEVLRTIARRLGASLRQTDAAARFGGDEFAIMVDGVDGMADIERIALKLGSAVAEPVKVGDNVVATTASLGIALCPPGGEEPEQLLTRADLALYRAKAEGRNQYRFYADSLDRLAHKKMVIAQHLRGAVERGEFELFYQPQVELVSRRIVGFEALIRWKHPERRDLSPAEFIPIAESNGAILPIGKWVIEEACSQIRKWRDQGVVAPVIAVNVSAAQFQFEGLEHGISAALRANAVAPDRFELELTESALMETSERHRAVLAGLQQLGLRLAIDDFGTGFSSLAYLSSFRVSRLKLASRFVGAALDGAADAAIVRACASLTRELGIEMVAEGVETLAEAELLVASGCQYAQGFLFGRPMSADAAAQLLSSSAASLDAAALGRLLSADARPGDW